MLKQKFKEIDKIKLLKLTFFTLLFIVKVVIYFIYLIFGISMVLGAAVGIKECRPYYTPSLGDHPHLRGYKQFYKKLFDPY